MASGTIRKNLLDDDLFVSQQIVFTSGISVTITFSSTRDNGFISITGNGNNRIALYAFSGMNGAVPVINRLSGADLDSLFSTGSGTITFSPNYGGALKIAAFNTSGKIAISTT